MGTTTDFIGHIDIAPALNESEELFLRALAGSRRYDRPDGPYSVPGNPAAEHDDPVLDVDRYNRIGHNQPSLWCQWVPGWGGQSLAWDGFEKFYASTQWLAYLIDHFLAPGAFALDSGLECFRHFTFDHLLNGTIASCNRDTRELLLIHVSDNHVFEESVVTRRQRAARERLPYEVEQDRWTKPRRRQSRTRG